MQLQKNKLEEFFRGKGKIPQDKVKYYIGWLNKFMAYYNGSLAHVSLRDLKDFGDELNHQGYEEWQVAQAQEAVLMYIEKFLEKLGKNELIEIMLLKFDALTSKAAIIVPIVHPGPFKNIGSSLLPSQMTAAYIFKWSWMNDRHN